MNKDEKTPFFLPTTMKEIFMGRKSNPATWYNHKSKTFKKNKRKGL